MSGIHGSRGPGQSDNGSVSDDDGVVQSEMDRALLRVVMDALAPLPEGAATVRQQWVEGAGMWFVKVRPRLASAARFDIALRRERDRAPRLLTTGAGSTRSGCSQ